MCVARQRKSTITAWTALVSSGCNVRIVFCQGLRPHHRLAAAQALLISHLLLTAQSEASLFKLVSRCFKVYQYTSSEQITRNPAGLRPLPSLHGGQTPALPSGLQVLIAHPVAAQHLPRSSATTKCCSSELVQPDGQVLLQTLVQFAGKC